VWIETELDRAVGNRKLRITRQQCRVWIETKLRPCMTPTQQASPGSNAGCGLKLDDHGFNPVTLNASPGSNAGCGLKQARTHPDPIFVNASPGSNAGCGLKHSGSPFSRTGNNRITRQQCRVWIETAQASEAARSHSHHPAAMPGVD